MLVYDGGFDSFKTLVNTTPMLYFIIFLEFVKLMNNFTLSRFWWANIRKSEKAGLRPAQSAD
jgi:hypothetical protein